MGYHVVRYSLLGRLGNFVAADAVRYERHSRVILRSERGLEIGEVLTPPQAGDAKAPIDGQILRRMTVEDQLLDGARLCFYFLGEVPPEAEMLTAQLAETYETAVEFRRFAETLTEGCGPGCGTEEAMGQGGCESCSSCAVATACGTKKS